MIKRNIYYLILASLFLGFSPLIPAQMKPGQNKNKTMSVPADSFKHSDVGNPEISGTVKVMKDGFDVIAGGADIWGVKDEFNFVYLERTGDFDLVSRIESLSDPNLYTKAGIMAREDLTGSCRHIYFQVFPNNNARNKNNGGCEYQYRLEKGGEMKAIYPKYFEGIPEFPVAFPNTWIRLQRIRNDFTGYYCTDGKNWKVYTTFTLELPGKLYVGLAVTSHDVKNVAEAKFRDIGEIIH